MLRIEVGDYVYDRDRSIEMRKGLIEYRDHLLTAQSMPDFSMVMLLSHTIGWLSYAIDFIYPPTPNPREDKQVTLQ